MTHFFSRTTQASTVLLIVAGLSLSACATKPDRDRPPRGEDRQDRPARTSGTFLQPAAFLFADMDSNQDKVTSRAEMLAGVQAEWDGFERNPSATVFANWSRRTLGSTDAKPTFMSFDRDFNGVVTKAEFTTEFETLFTQFDKNTDGAIDRSEMIVAFEAPAGRAQRGGQRDSRGERGQGGRGGGRPQR